MRLSEIRSILLPLSTIGDMSLRASKIDHETIKLYNINKFKELIESISMLPFFEKEIDLIRKSPLYTTTHDILSVKDTVYENIIKVSSYVVNASDALKRVLENIISASEENTVLIKLPCSESLQSLTKYLDQIEKAISQVILNDYINGQLKIKGWESGSFWIELYLGCSAAVMLIGSIAWSAAVISKKWHEDKILENQVRALEIKNDSLEDLLEKQREASDLLLINETRALSTKHFDAEIDTELSERLKLSVKTFAKLIREGAEVHPALNTPETVGNLFPNFKEISTIESKIKQIEQKVPDK